MKRAHVAAMASARKIFVSYANGVGASGGAGIVRQHSQPAVAPEPTLTLGILAFYDLLMGAQMGTAQMGANGYRRIFDESAGHHRRAHGQTVGYAGLNLFPVRENASVLIILGVGLNTGQASGFRGDYQNTLPDGRRGNPSWNGDQAHHFAAFFQFGYRHRATAGENASSILEYFQGLDSGVMNLGDVRLGNVAAQTGADLRAGLIGREDVGQRISETLCNH